MLRGARIQAEWIDPPSAEAIRHNDRERLLRALLEPVEVDEEDRVLAARLMAERSPEDIAAALVHAHRAALPRAEELPENTPAAAQADRQERHREGFEDIVWFRMDIGRRQNADPRWILPLLCRRGHITRNEIGAIRIGPGETYFQVPRAIADKFAAAVRRTETSEDAGDIRIEVAPDSPREVARQHRKAGPRDRPGSHDRPGPRDRPGPQGTRPSNAAKPQPGGERPAKKAWPKKPHRKGDQRK